MSAIIGHGGDTRWFHTNLALFPELDLGVYVSFNSREGGAARSRFFTAFVDRYFPVDEAVAVPPDDFVDRAGRFVGEYRANRFSHTTIAKFGTNTLRLGVTNRGTLRALGAHWIEVAPLTFEEESGSRTLVFREADDGSITHFFLEGTPIVAWERVPISEHPNLHNPLLILVGTVLILTFLAPILGWASRHWYGVSAWQLDRISFRARFTLWSAAALLLIGSGATLGLMDGADLTTEGPSAFGIALLLLVLAILPTLGSVVLMIQLWRRGEGRRTVRVLYSLATITLCMFIWQMNVWNMLGWKY